MTEEKFRNHITLSSSILEELAVKHFEEMTGKQARVTKWICDSQFGFAGFRIYFEIDESNEDFEEREE